MRLGEMAMGEGLVSSKGVEQALESQVVHGGRIGTNLVELGLLEEKDLGRLLGKQHKVAFASGTMVADPAALRLLDAHFATSKDVLPMRVDATRITVATIDPHDIETLDAIGFRTGKRVVAVVVPEFRMNQLLRRYYKAFRAMRAIDMNVVRPSRTAAVAGNTEEKVASDLISEEEFQGLYASALRGGSEPGKVGAPPPTTKVEAAAPLIAVALTPEEPAQEPPLSFTEAQKLLLASNDREDIARTILRFAGGKWKRALMLSVQGDLVTGWRGVGQGVREEAVRQIGIALRGQSTFKLVRDTCSHFVGPVSRDAGATVLYNLLGGGFPKTVVLLPLLVRSKLVHILYVDNGPNKLTPPDVGELLILAQSVARSYEELMRRRKNR